MEQQDNNIQRFLYETPELTDFQYRDGVVIGTGESWSLDVNTGDGAGDNGVTQEDGE